MRSAAVFAMPCPRDWRPGPGSTRSVLRGFCSEPECLPKPLGSQIPMDRGLVACQSSVEGFTSGSPIFILILLFF